MTFLLPIFWSVMALGAAIVAFYLIRERPRKRRLSTLLFWDQLPAKVYETPLWRKLRRWVSLLLQLLFLALLVCALARPAADWELSGVRSRVFVLDPSASMGATDVSPSRFARAKAELRARVERMRFFDEAALILASDPPEILSGWTRSRRRLLEALDRAQPAGTDADVRPALEIARNLVATRNKAQIEFFTDGVGAEPPDKALLEGVVERRMGAEKPRNRGFSLFAARRSLVAPGELTLTARVEAAGEEPSDAEIEIARDGALVDAQAIRIDPKMGWRKSWTLRADKGGAFTASLRGAKDDLAADDSATVTLEPLRAIDVVLVSPPDGFLEAVFKAMSGVKVSRVWPAEKAGAGDPGKVWVFNRAAPPADFHALALVLLAPQTSGFWGERRGDIKEPLISDVDEDSPLTRFASLDKVRVGRAAAFEPAPGARVLASSFGSPVLFGKWEDRDARWLALTFDLEQSDFVLRTAFPILMENVVQSLRAGDDAGNRADLPGVAETRLAARPVAATTPEAKAEWSAPWTVRPLWWWAVLLGAIWLLAEWRTYHRRITE